MHRSHLHPITLALPQSTGCSLTREMMNHVEAGFLHLLNISIKRLTHTTAHGPCQSGLLCPQRKRNKTILKKIQMATMSPYCYFPIFKRGYCLHLRFNSKQNSKNTLLYINRNLVSIGRQVCVCVFEVSVFTACQHSLHTPLLSYLSPLSSL